MAPTEDIDPMDQDDFGSGNGGTEDFDREMAAKKMKSDTKPDSAPQSGNTGPTPMQHFIAVTPLGNNRPCPPMKPLVFMNGAEKLPPIAATKPKTGFKPGLGCTKSKDHPILSVIGEVNFNLQSHSSYSVVDHATPVKASVGSAPSGSDHLQQTETSASASHFDGVVDQPVIQQWTTACSASSALIESESNLNS